jgi:peptidoglycan hydrolase CwlO-like protein
MCAYGITKSVSTTDTNKILHALAEMQKDIHSLKEGQAALQGDVKSLTEGQKSLEGGQKDLQNTANQQGKAIAELREGQKTLDLKLEAFHTEQVKANQEVLGTLTEVVDINAQHYDKRFTRIEKTLTSSR